ncbi:MAG: futalosine synthase [Geobacter sp.]|nr:futalosine synthase [Geobacter sp.]
MTVRIGQIEYANCVPLFMAFRELCPDAQYSYISGVPAVLNGLLAQGEIDLCPSSSIVYGNDPNRYWLLPDLSISAVGEVQSVLLFSRKPLQELNGARIGLTNESDTSVALLKIILNRFHGFANEYQRTGLPLTEAFSFFDALLLIGDMALKESLAGAHCHVYDLGAIWQQQTGFPFVFALWIVNRAAVAGKHAEVALLLQSLLKAKELSKLRLERYAAEATGLDWMSAQQRAAYWRIISYDLDEQQLAGLSLFYRHAAELGIIAEAPELSFFSIYSP